MPISPATQSPLIEGKEASGSYQLLRTASTTHANQAYVQALSARVGTGAAEARGDAASVARMTPCHIKWNNLGSTSSRSQAVATSASSGAVPAR